MRDTGKTRAARGCQLWFGVLSAAAVIATTAACGRSSSSGRVTQASAATVGTPARKQQYAFGMVQIGNDAFFTAAFRGAQAAAQRLGNVKLIFTGPAQASIAKQIAAVQALATRRVDGIILSPLDATALQAPVQQAAAAGIPTVLYNSTLANAALAKAAILSSNTHGGVTAGKYMCTLLGGKGQVAIVEAVTGLPALVQRWDGFKQGLRENCPDVRVVAAEVTQNVQTTATAVVRALRVRYPHLAGLFADDVVNGLGVAAALATLGASRPKVVAFDAEPAAVPLLRRGQLDGLIAQQPAEMGELAVQTMLAVKEGKPYRASRTLGTVLLTRSNIDREAQYVY